MRRDHTREYKRCSVYKQNMSTKKHK